MNEIQSRVRSSLVWLVPLVVLLLLIAWETRWGRELLPAPEAEVKAAPQPVSTALLPEYRIDGGLEARRETSERTLFNPTRRPAPPAPSVATGKPVLQRGQFVLTGTTVVGEKATAFLREVATGKGRHVQKGENINGMLVAEVTPDRVRLMMGDESEDLTLRVAAGPRTTVQPAVPPAIQAGLGGAPPAGAPAPVIQAAPTPVIQDVGEILAQRRRAARATETPFSVPQPTTPQPAATPSAAPAPSAPDPRWQDVYRGLSQQRK